MNDFSDYLDEATSQINPSRSCGRPIPTIVYHAHVNGSVVECHSFDEARNLSKHFERKITQHPDLQNWLEEEIKIYSLAEQLMKSDLRKEYPDIPDAIFEVVYSVTFDGTYGLFDDFVQEFEKNSKMVNPLVEMMRALGKSGV